MITSIQGTLVAATPLRVVLEVQGLGYEINVPVTSAERLPTLGSTAKLHTLVVYREDSQTVYGFATPAERDFFRLMIEHVTGIGPKMALSIMSRLSLASLESAIRTADVATLAKCPGIGKKTAERLVMELKAKVGGGPDSGTASFAPGEAGHRDGPASSPHRDAVAALVALGYKVAEADQAIRLAAAALGGTPTTENLIKRALNP